MSKFTCNLLSVAVVALSLKTVFALTSEDKAALNEYLVPILIECSSEHGISEGKINEVKDSFKKHVINPCLLGCLMKNVKLMNNQGNFDPGTGLINLTKLMKNKDSIAKLEKATNTCLKVNEVPVSDGAAGCERAKLVFNCVIDNKIEVPF